MGSGTTAVAVVAIAGVAAGAVYLLKTAGGSTSGHGTLTVQGNPFTPTSSITWSVTGVTPGALIQFGFDTAPSGVSGYYVADTATADASGNASGSYTFVSGVNDQPGTTIYALAYDTAIGSLAGYSNAVSITFT